jgi:hypothetical protein
MRFPVRQWNNYSTSYMGEGSDSMPLLVTAIPYNGIYEMGDQGPGSSAVNLSFAGSAYRFRSNLADNQRTMTTYDSNAVYFLAPGIFPWNADQYEYRVLEDSVKVVKDWTEVDRFTDKRFLLNSFRREMGFLGGYSTRWGHGIAVELRRKWDLKLLSAAIVYWEETRPALTRVITPSELTKYILGKNGGYGGDAAGRPVVDSNLKGRVLQAGETSLIFYCDAEIYKKEALEYSLTRDGKLVRPWGANEHDNNTIWLQGLGQGEYRLLLRYAKQRHNILIYPFRILPAWYESWGFRLGIGILGVGLVAAIVLVFQLRRARRKAAVTEAKKERQALELRSIHAQLNPHFVFNAMSSIQGLINRNEVAAANRYLSDFGRLVRHYLTDSERQWVPLQREVEMLETYLSLERLRFNFEYTIQCEAGLPLAELEIPSLLLQPLVENAVRHGVAGMAQEGRIGLRIFRVRKDLCVEISDNGPGFDIHGSYTGYGLRLTRERVRVLNELGSNGPIELRSGGGIGTTIGIIFINWLS